jgi:hypothetical protein
MNAPKTPKRFSRNRRWGTTPDGRYASALNAIAFSTALGQLLPYWTHLEEKMIEIMRQLLGGTQSLPARQIFRAIGNNHGRIKVLRALLEKAQINVDKDTRFDEIIKEFSALNEKRNEYVHGLWYTHESGRVFIAEPTPDETAFFDKREIKIEELEETIERMSKLFYKIMQIMFPGYPKHPSEQPSSPETPLQPPPVETP